MHLLLATLFGILLAAATYLLLARSLPRMILGLLLLSNAANLAIFAGGRVLGTAPPLVASGAQALAAGAANPLPQALVLTAIVISLGLMAFALVLAWATHEATGELDAEALRDAEPPGLPATDPVAAAAAEPAPALAAVASRRAA
jgi:multisubunit Na+/H+ antiporter MnhC subunit